MSRTSQVGAVPERTAGVALTEFTTKRRGPLRRFFYERPVWMDAVVVLVYLLLSSLGFFSETFRENPLPVLFCLLIALVLFFRRRFPVRVLLATSVLEVFSALSMANAPDGLGVSSIFALYAVAAARGGRFGFIATAAVSIPTSVLLVLLSLSRDPVGLGQTVSMLLLPAGFMVLANVIATGIGVSVWRDRQHELELRAWASRNAELASANERNRIAREMHDVVAHSLSVMIALADGAQVALKRAPDRAEEALVKLSQTGRSALSDMQRVLGVLRLEGSKEQGERKPLPADFEVESLIAGFRTAGMPLSVSISGPALPSDPAFRLTVYRIVQESLTNVLRYAQSVSRVELKMEHEHPHVRLRIADDGRGSTLLRPPKVGSGNGLIGMRERVAAYQGEVSAGPAASGGWLVDARLQCPDSKDGEETP
ncbi:sensor histidine kinase [Arthrobacter russicus]|uniref:histidine kinase n=1 Tax=Arthrobacter russicus TaxID=172040 RepID=A0ABU1JE96_9MICC|nr:histidine kinase [Arthrobacter russicus]MDR6269717.1 signal transduction histidine kinase [Arthrobacter russicus]